MNGNFVSYKIHIESTMNDTTDLSSNSRNQSHLVTSHNIVYARSQSFSHFLFSGHHIFPDSNLGKLLVFLVTS